MTSSKQRLEYALMEDQQYLVAGLDRDQARTIAGDVARQLARVQTTSRNVSSLEEGFRAGEPISEQEYGNAIQSSQRAAELLATQIESAMRQARAQARAGDSDNDSVYSNGSNTGTEFTAASSANGFQPAPYPVQNEQDLAWLLQNFNMRPGSVSSRAVSSTGVGGGGPSSRDSARHPSSRHHQQRGGGSGNGPHR
ncbi:hypothetical protein ABT336_18150 [Micromonospora sp. NPDC000207]|uniref:hypothetical protein n=1 Tax=Micromonospora sp. NPDC000207 TaxID=3154246 RepID=UPI0033231E1D